MSSKGASGTTTSTGSTAPWADQQPYLDKIFTEADKLYNGTPPKYYPDSTYVPYTSYQNDAIAGTIDLSRNDPITKNSTDTATDILGGSGIYNNKGLQKLQSLMDITPGSKTGTDTLTSEAETNPVTGTTGYDTLNTLGSSNAATDTAGYDTLNTLGSKNYGVDNLAGDALENLSKTNYGSTAYNEGAADQQSIAAGDRLKKDNPYTKELTDSILADVVPGIQSQFIAGGMLSSPEAARATTAGAVAGLAPSLFKQYQFDEGQNLTAAQNIAEDALKGTSISSDAATQYGKLNLGGIGEQRLAADSAVKDLLAGTGEERLAADSAVKDLLAGTEQQQTAATTLGDQAIKGYSAQTTAANDATTGYGKGVDQIINTLAAAPDLQKMQYNDLTQGYTAGSLVQKDQQKALDDLIARWNYDQTLPYDSLNALIGAVTGNYGGSTSLTQPFFDNSTSASNVIGTGANLGVLGSLLL